jgi:hypothetical protein
MLAWVSFAQPHLLSLNITRVIDVTYITRMVKHKKVKLLLIGVRDYLRLVDLLNTCCDEPQ